MAKASAFIIARYRDALYVVPSDMADTVARTGRPDIYATHFAVVQPDGSLRLMLNDHACHYRVLQATHRQDIRSAMAAFIAAEDAAVLTREANNPDRHLEARAAYADLAASKIETAEVEPIVTDTPLPRTRGPFGRVSDAAKAREASKPLPLGISPKSVLRTRYPSLVKALGMSEAIAYARKASPSDLAQWSGPLHSPAMAG